MHALRIPHFLLLLTSTFLALDAPTPAQAFGLGSLREDLLPLWPRSAGLERRINITNNNDEDPADWVIQDVYSGVDFFDESYWDFFTWGDPTGGAVNYVDRDFALSHGLAYVSPDGKAHMQVDQWTTLAQGQARNSVRISSTKVYNEGLFILDVENSPWGCGVWPAWWTVGPNWPTTGEIDIIEGVHDNVHNQVAFHTDPGCVLDNATSSFTGDLLRTNCDASIDFNSGCAIVDASQASYGPEFNELGGGVFAMQWTKQGIKIWFFHRYAIPGDISTGRPNPSLWGLPSAALAPGSCNPTNFFANHSITFDITLCGQWAGGTSYADSGCPGTCIDRIMSPANFVNATWSINSLTVFHNIGLSSAFPRRDVALLSFVPFLVLGMIWISFFLS